jgi:hypothetical protein
MRMKKIEERLNGRFKKVEADAVDIASKLAEFEVVTKDAIMTLESTLINFSKMSIARVEERVNVDMDEQNESRNSMHIQYGALSLEEQLELHGKPHGLSLDADNSMAKVVEEMIESNPLDSKVLDNRRGSELSID